MDYLKPILGWSGLHSIPGSCLALQYSHGICSAGLISWFWKCQFQSSSRGPGSTPSPAPLPLHGIACLAWSGELAPSHAPLTDLKNSACVCTCHIFYRQGSFMCNQCKWPMYVLCFINSHLSLLLPATALPYQDSSARPSVLGFLCLLHLISEICFIQRLSLSQCLPLALRVVGTPTLPMAKSFWDGLLQPLPRSGGSGVEREASVHVSSILCMNISTGRELQKYFLKIKCCCWDRNIKSFPTPISTFLKRPCLAIILLTLQKCSIC